MQPFLRFIIAYLLVLIPWTAFPDEPATIRLRNIIDEHIESKLSTLGLLPAGPCSDADFVRRIHLDLTGVIPAATVAREFIESSNPDKRVQLVNRLLDSDQFAAHLATIVDVMLMERRPDKYVTTPEWRDYLRQSFTENKPYNVLMSEILGADGVDPQLRPAIKFYLDRAVDKDVLVRDIGRLFLGVNLQCAQCHDHPDIEDYLHRYYHGLSVFVAGSKTFKQPDGKFVLQEVVMREVEFASVFDPETTNKTGPRLIEALLDVPEFAEGEEYVEKPSRTVRSVPKFSLRKLLSERLPSKETPEFARNVANRFWALMMGRGIVHPLDMHHAANPPSHPELLDALTRLLEITDYNLKAYLRAVAFSEAYQRSSRAPAGIDPEELPVDSYVVANLKGLSPEQLFESLLVATQAEAILDRQIDEAVGDEAVGEVANEATAAEEAEPVADDALAEARRAERAARVAEFVTVFGNVPGTPESEFASSLPQALFLANSETVSAWIPPQLGNLTEQLVALDDVTQIADTLFLAVLSRFPLDDERKWVAEHLQNAGQERRTRAISELVWSQLASAEFRLNH